MAEDELKEHFNNELTVERAYSLAMRAYDGDEKLASKYAAAVARQSLKKK